MRMLSLRPLVAGFGFAFLLGAGGPAAAALATIDTQAQHAMIVDFQTGAVLLDKQADERMPPASMSKMMLEYVVFGMLKEGRVKLEDTLPVSEKAWRTGGSKMFVPLGGQVKIDDLLRGMIIQSGNDACIVLAEGLAGSEQAMVDLENKKAQEIGLTGSHFANVTGLPAPDHYMTARDLATLARHLIQDFPEYYHYDSEKDFTYNGIKQGNRNPLLYKDMGADGLKTGHTEEAGYSVTASAVRDGRRIIAVLAGMPSMKARASESERLMDWAFREFQNYRLVKAGEPVDEAPVWLGTEAKVPVTTTQDAFVTLTHKARRDMKVTALYDGPVKAPAPKGTAAGKLHIEAPDMDPVDVPLVTAADVQRLGPVGRMAAAAGYLLWGKKN